MNINRQKIEYTYPGYFPIITYITTYVQPNNENTPPCDSSSNWHEGPNYKSYHTKVTEDEITTIITETCLEKMLNCSFQF